MALDVISVIKADGTGDYTDLTSWEAAVNTDLTAATGNDTRQIAEIYDTETVASFPTLEIVGGTHDYATGNYLLIRAAVGNEYNSITGSGGKIVSSVSDPTYNFVVRINNFVEVRRLNISMSGVNSLHYSGGFRVEGCVFSAGANNTSGVDYISYGFSEIVNSLFLVTLYSTTNFAGIPRYATLLNCTLISKAGTGAYGGDIVAHVCNCTNVTVYHEDTKKIYDSLHNGTEVTCAQNNNGSASLGAGNIDNLLTTDFTDYANGDYSVATGSQLIDAGTDLSVQFTTDIVGTVRG